MPRQSQLDGLDLDSMRVIRSVGEFEDLVRQDRGFESEKEWREFLFPLHPMKLDASVYFDDSLKKAASMLRDAARDKTRVMIYGDYDVDGISATAVLWEALEDIGLTAQPFLPSRTRHGYGLTEIAVEDILARDPRPELIVTVDNGITAQVAIKKLRKAGLRVIITDHHAMPEDGAPEADVVVHSTALCGTTVAWFLARELSPSRAERSLDLCGLATMSDQVPLTPAVGAVLTQANRSFSVYGVKAIRETSRIGLQALLRVFKVSARFLDGRQIQFKLVPLLNAFGRMGEAIDGLRLVCGRKQQAVDLLADQAIQLNQARQEQFARMLEKGVEQASGQVGDVIALYHDEFHEGLLGLLAGRLVEMFHKPAVVMGRSEQGSGADGSVIKGSVRSMQGVHAVEFMTQFKDLLIDLGGHPMAAGFSLNVSNLQALLSAILIARAPVAEIMSSSMEERQGDAPLAILNHEAMTNELAELVHHLEPFGQANPQPMVIVRDLEIVRFEPLGRSGEHRKAIVQLNTGTELELLEFRFRNDKGELMGKGLPDEPGKIAHLLARISLNHGEIQLIGV